MSQEISCVGTTHTIGSDDVCAVCSLCGKLTIIIVEKIFFYLNAWQARDGKLSKSTNVLEDQLWDYKYSLQPKKMHITFSFSVLTTIIHLVLEKVHGRISKTKFSLNLESYEGTRYEIREWKIWRESINGFPERDDDDAIRIYGMTPFPDSGPGNFSTQAFVRGVSEFLRNTGPPKSGTNLRCERGNKLNCALKIKCQRDSEESAPETWKSSRRK